MDRIDLDLKLKEDSFYYTNWQGKGPLTHIAHATGLCAGAYSSFVQRLVHRLDMIGLDFRGHGRTKAKADPSKLKNWNVFHDDFEAFLNHIDQPVIAIGHSLGGTVTLKLAACKPEPFKALILIEPGIMPPMWRPFVYMVQKTGLSGHVPFVTRATGRKNHWSDRQSAWDCFHGKGPFRQWKNDFLKEYVREGLCQSTNSSVQLSCDPAWEGRCLAMAPYDIWRYVGKITIPTLVLYGKQSTTFLPSVVRRIQRLIPDAVIKGFEETGHFVPMERPDETAKAIFHFLEEKGLLSDHAMQ